MKKIILILFIGLSISGYSTEKKEFLVTDGVTEAVSGAVSTGKNILKGLKKGIDKGRVEGNSTDEAIIILDQKAFNEYIDCTILSVEKTVKYYEIKVGLKNKSKETVRLANLSEKKVLQLKDKEGYVSYSLHPILNITIPEESGVRANFRFLMEGIPSNLKLYGVNFEIDNTKIKVGTEKEIYKTLNDVVEELEQIEKSNKE